MVTRETESEVRAVFRKAIQSACDELGEKEMLEAWWPEGYAERLAEMVTQAIALMAESCEMVEGH